MEKIRSFEEAMKKIGFTLAEIMIVLTIIGVLTMILLPIANHSRPDEAVMKFKKADTTLKNVIRELVTSDKYYCDGDLGSMKKGESCLPVLNNTTNGARTYLCNTFADLLATKKINCSSGTTSAETINSSWLLSNEKTSATCTGEPVHRTVTEETIEATKKNFDKDCKASSKTIGKEIITTDDIVYYQGGAVQFGSYHCPNPDGSGTYFDLRFFSPPNQFPANFGDATGFDIVYKLFCIDIDGFNDSTGSANCDDVKDICPFGYGIRADGKILSGARADEWLEKGFQKGKDDN